MWLYFGLLFTCAFAIEFQYLSAPWTPFNDDQSVNYEAIACSHSLHAKNGVTFAWVAGNFGQWTSLTDTERLTIFEHWVQANRAATKKINLIAHVGSNSLQSACELARQTTLRFGKDLAGISAIGPSFLDRPPTLEVLVDWMVKINSCQAITPKVPFYYYHIPGTTGIHFKMSDFVRALAAKGVHLGGIKFVEDNVLEWYNVTQYLGPSSNVFWAVTPKLRAMPFGATKYVLAEDFMGPYMKKIAEAFFAGQMQTAVQWELNYNAVMDATGLGASRYVDGMLDIKCAVGPPRLPQVPITSAQFKAEWDQLTAIGFFEFVKNSWPKLNGTNF